MEKHFKYLALHLSSNRFYAALLFLLLFANSYAQQPFSIPKIYDYDASIDSIISPYNNQFKGSVKEAIVNDSIRVVFDDSTFYYLDKKKYYFSKDGLRFNDSKQVKPLRYSKSQDSGKEQEQWFDNRIQQNSYTVVDGKLIYSTHGNSFTNYTYMPNEKLYYIQMYFADTLDVGYDQLDKTNEVDEQYISIQERLFHKLTYNKKDQLIKRETFSSDSFSDTYLVTVLDNYVCNNKGQVLAFNRNTIEYESPELTSVNSRLDQLNYKEAKRTTNYYDPEKVTITYNKQGKINSVKIETGTSFKITFNITYPKANKVIIDVISEKENELQRWVTERQRNYLVYDKKGNITSYKNVVLNKALEETINQFTKRKISYY